MRGELLGNVDAIAEGAHVDRARGPDPHGFARVLIDVGHELGAQPVAPFSGIEVLALELHHVGGVNVGGPACGGHGDVPGDVLRGGAVEFGVFIRGAVSVDGVGVFEVAFDDGGVAVTGGGGAVGKGKAHSENAHSSCGEGGDGTDLE